MNIPQSVLSRIAGGSEVTLTVPPAAPVESIDPYVPGAILENQWGYDQTNVDFYVVIKRCGQWVTIAKIRKVESSDGPLTMTGKVVPANPVEPIGKSFRRLLKQHCGRPDGFSIHAGSGGGWCRIWNGKPVHYSTYA